MRAKRAHESIMNADSFHASSSAPTNSSHPQRSSVWNVNGRSDAWHGPYFGVGQSKA